MTLTLADHVEMVGIQVKRHTCRHTNRSTANELSPTIDVVIVGTDVYLLITLTQLLSSYNHLYLFKPGSGKYPNNVYNISGVKNNMRGLSNWLLFLRTVPIGDTTPALYRQGKKKTFNLVKHNPELQTLVEVFIDFSPTPCWPCMVLPARRCPYNTQTPCGQCRGIGCSNDAQPDESDGELDAHHDEDRTDPERTDEEGDI